ncbi:MAG: hypothetical protein Q8Q14_12315 [Gemmatimonadales bacterium]|nr:hypothetical protein [Gemmatimonadales bacterium]
MANGNGTMTTTRAQRPPVEMVRRGAGALMMPETFEAAYRMAEVFSKSGLVPDHYRGRPADVMVAMQMGAELGLPPMVSLNYIAVVKGRASLWGNGAKALVLAHPDCVGLRLYTEGEGEQMVAVCVARRRGRDDVERRFTVAQAKKAGLWGKHTWSSNPDDMLMWKAFHRAASDQWADVLCGLHVAEDLMSPEPIRGEPRTHGSNADIAAVFEAQVIEPGAPTFSESDPVQFATPPSAPSTPATPSAPANGGTKDDPRTVAGMLLRALQPDELRTALGIMTGADLEIPDAKLSAEIPGAVVYAFGQGWDVERVRQVVQQVEVGG